MNSKKWWFRIDDEIRECTWYICIDCMVASRFGTKGIKHKENCIHYVNSDVKCSTTVYNSEADEIVEFVDPPDDWGV